MQSIIKQLVSELLTHQNNYYNLDEPSITDGEYDILLRELITLEQQYPQFKVENSPTDRVGSKNMGKFKKVTHQEQMLSLQNALDFTELKKFISDCKNDLSVEPTFVCEYKIDGLAINLQYIDGILKTAVTRGDGEVGEDVTLNILEVAEIPHTIPYLGNINIRGEIYLSKSVFNAINDSSEIKYANPRNLAAGTIRQLDYKKVAERQLQFFAYYTDCQDFTTHYDLMKLVSSFKIPINDGLMKFSTYSEIVKYIEQLTKIRETLNYEIDGVVIKVDKVTLQNELGQTAKFPK